MTRVAGRAPPAFAPQVNDMRKRLAILFDLLNNYSEDEATGGAGPALKKETVQELLAIAEAVKSRDMEGAQGLLTELMKREAGNWMVSYFLLAFVLDSSSIVLGMCLSYKETRVC